MGGGGNQPWSYDAGVLVCGEGLGHREGLENEAPENAGEGA